MSLGPAPTIESFYRFCAEKKLMAVRCAKCDRVTVPPRNMCVHCGGSEVAWTELPGRGKLVTYTVIHISPARFQSFAPYVVGIVEFDEGARLPGMIRNLKPESIKVGMELGVDFETTVPSEWPRWPRYFFTEV